MNKHFTSTGFLVVITGLFWQTSVFHISAQAREENITIHLHGVSETKISLLSLSGENAQKPIAVIQIIKNGETTTLQVPEENLPGEFVLRFDYKENSSSTPYPSEKRIIINNQDLELWVHPIYCNNADSTWFQKDEKENTVYVRFHKENARQKEMLGLLQNFLLNYDNANSDFYREGITEYEKRRKAYNQWIAEQTTQYKALFVSSLFGFYHVPQIDWQGSDADRKQSFRDNYFEGTDFNDPLILKTTNMKEWMDGYVNLYGELATSTALRDSLFTLAGKNVIEKARKGHTLIYGWMVDYFFSGYESFNIQKGIKMLQPFLDDPDCLTSRRLEINRRLKGIETLLPGTFAPNIIMQDSDNQTFELNALKTAKQYILILFWSADCNHCAETVEKLYPWCQKPEVHNIIDIVAISLDETNTEIGAWQKKIKELNGWTHLRAETGVRSKVATDYYILGIPVMVFLNARTKEIIALPEGTEELIKLISKD